MPALNAWLLCPRVNPLLCVLWSRADTTNSGGQRRQTCSTPSHNCPLQKRADVLNVFWSERISKNVEHWWEQSGARFTGNRSNHTIRAEICKMFSHHMMRFNRLSCQGACSSINSTTSAPDRPSSESYSWETLYSYVSHVRSFISFSSSVIGWRPSCYKPLNVFVWVYCLVPMTMNKEIKEVKCSVALDFFNSIEVKH